MGHPTRRTVDPTAIRPTTMPTTTSAAHDDDRHKADDVGEMGEQEGDEAADEALAGQHQEDVADEREREGRNEPGSRGLALEDAPVRGQRPGPAARP